MSLFDDNNNNEENIVDRSILSAHSTSYSTGITDEPRAKKARKERTPKRPKTSSSSSDDPMDEGGVVVGTPKRRTASAPRSTKRSVTPNRGGSSIASLSREILMQSPITSSSSHDPNGAPDKTSFLLDAAMMAMDELASGGEPMLMTSPGQPEKRRYRKRGTMSDENGAIITPSSKKDNKRLSSSKKAKPSSHPLVMFGDSGSSSNSTMAGDNAVGTSASSSNNAFSSMMNADLSNNNKGGEDDQLGPDENNSLYYPPSYSSSASFDLGFLMMSRQSSLATLQEAAEQEFGRRSTSNNDLHHVFDISPDQPFQAAETTNSTTESAHDDHAVDSSSSSSTGNNVIGLAQLNRSLFNEATGLIPHDLNHTGVSVSMSAKSMTGVDLRVRVDSSTSSADGTDHECAADTPTAGRAEV